jgi:hypothetical protein
MADAGARGSCVHCNGKWRRGGGASPAPTTERRKRVDEWDECYGEMDGWLLRCGDGGIPDSFGSCEGEFA